jgi:LmbE family N-acetylglucosaminyl deacetylase
VPSVLALFAHPDDIEFVSAGTMLLLAERGWDLHYMNLCTGHGGSVEMDGPTTSRTRLAEAKEAARILGATFYPPISDDLELTYSVPLLKKVAAVVRQAKPTIVLTHSPADYMEDHMAAARLAVTAAFAHGIPNFETDPPEPSFGHDVAVYHAMPHGLCDPLRAPIHAEIYVNTASVHSRKREALAAHTSQKNWLDVSQGMDSYLVTMDEASASVAQHTGQFALAEGWRRHLHLGLSTQIFDPLSEALTDSVWLNPDYHSSHLHSPAL